MIIISICNCGVNLVGNTVYRARIPDTSRCYQGMPRRGAVGSDTRPSDKADTLAVPLPDHAVPAWAGKVCQGEKDQPASVHIPADNIRA